MTSPYMDMARDAGYDGDEARQVAESIEYQHWIESQRPTEGEVCASNGHAYYGDDGGRGRCYCGYRLYSEGGPADEEESDDAS